MGRLLGSDFPAKLRKLTPKNLAFGKRITMRGKYYQDVRDQHGKLVARVPWNQTVKKEVRAVVEVTSKKETDRSLDTLGLDVPGWNYETGSFDPKGGSARWSLPVFATLDPVPIGEPGGRVRGARSGRSGKWLGGVFERIDPVQWGGLIGDLPARLREAGGSNFRLRVTVMDRDGNEHTLIDPTQRNVESMTQPSDFREMLATACSIAGQRYGYAGATELLSVDLILGAQAEGAEDLAEVDFPYGYNF